MHVSVRVCVTRVKWEQRAQGVGLGLSAEGPGGAPGEGRGLQAQEAAVANVPSSPRETALREAARVGHLEVRPEPQRTRSHVGSYVGGTT